MCGCAAQFGSPFGGAGARRSLVTERAAHQRTPFLSLRGAKRRGNPHPLGCVTHRRKRERIPTSACGLLGMTGEK